MGPSIRMELLLVVRHYRSGARSFRSFSTYLLYLELCLLTAPDSGMNRAWLPCCVKASAGVDHSTEILVIMVSPWTTHGSLHRAVLMRVIGSYQLPWPTHSVFQFGHLTRTSASPVLSC